MEFAAFLRQHGVTRVAMESTAQYWRPVWMTLEEEFTLTLAQACFYTRPPRPLVGQSRCSAHCQTVAVRESDS
jgi:hypothetical protein